MTMDYAPEPVPTAATEWWAECFPQWKGNEMTTPAGQPSVQPSPKQVTGLMDPSIAQTQASASGGGQYNGSSEPNPKVVGSNMEDVRHASTEGATVGNDQSQLDVTAPQPEQTT